MRKSTGTRILQINLDRKEPHLLSTASPQYVSFTLVEYKIDSGLRRQIFSMDFSLLIYRVKNFGGMTSKIPFNWKILYLQKTKGKKKTKISGRPLRLCTVLNSIPVNSFNVDKQSYELALFDR